MRKKQTQNFRCSAVHRGAGRSTGAISPRPAGNFGRRLDGWLFGWLFGACLAGSSLLTAQMDRSWPMFQDPPVVVPEVATFYDAALLELWGQALDRPEEELRRQVLRALITAADRGLDLASAQAGTSDLSVRLWRLLSDAQQPLLLRQMAAEALVALRVPLVLKGPALLEQLAPWGAVRVTEVVDERLSEEVLAASQEQEGEPQIARLLVIWGERAGDPHQPAGTRRSALRQVARITAARGSAATFGLPQQGQELIGLLRQLVAAETAEAQEPVGVRVAAAAALATADPATAQQVAESLRQGDRTSLLLKARLLAGAKALEGSARQQAITQLLGLVSSRDREVAAFAARILASADPAAVDPAWAERDHEQVRLALIQALATRLKGGERERVPELGQLLADRHPQVRTNARAALAAVLGDPADALHRAVADWCRQLPEELRGSELGLEQAALLTAEVGLAAQPPWLTEALHAPAGAVQAAAARATWKIGDASVIPTVESLVRATAAPTFNADPNEVARWVHWVGYLGAQQHAPVSEIFRPWIAKRAPVAVPVRAAGIEALGRIHAGSADARLLNQLNARLMDLTSEEPESLEVQWTSSIAMGRIGGEAAVNFLRQAMASGLLMPELEATCAWALSQVTGEEVLAPVPPARPARGWYLEPVN